MIQARAIIEPEADAEAAIEVIDRVAVRSSSHTDGGVKVRRSVYSFENAVELRNQLNEAIDAFDVAVEGE